MSSATIDTLEVTKELKAAGFDQSQAEALARIVRRSQDLDLSAFATKSDLKEAVSELRVEIAGTKADILRWMVVTQLAVGGFIIAAIKLVH